MTPVALAQRDGERRSAFAGADVCNEAGFRLSEGRRPRFEDDVWDFSEVVGLPVQMGPSLRRLDFTAISHPAWRVVAKELMLALLAPRHEAVAVLANALRTPLHLRTCAARLAELRCFLDWLSAEGVITLGDIDEVHCEAYLAHRRYVRDAAGEVVGERGPGIRRGAVQVMVDLVSYAELFSLDRTKAGLRPFSGATASAVAGMGCGRDGNKTAPLADAVLSPLLAAALYLVQTIGRRAVNLAQQASQATRASRLLPELSRPAADQLGLVLQRHIRDGEPLCRLTESEQRARLGRGYAPGDRLLAVSLHALANEAGLRRFRPVWLDTMREPIEETLGKVGTEKPWGRDAEQVEAPGAAGSLLAWTLPLYGAEVLALAGVVRTACIIVVAALSGMRSSELMELRVGCALPPEELGPGLFRHRLASRVVKGQPLGGTADYWVVIEPVHQAVELAEALLGDLGDGALLFGRFAFDVRFAWFRAWVDGPFGARLGLRPIGDHDVTLRALRRTLAVELAYRPGGVLAAKVHLKHISVATTEGYASRPGGAQGALLAEINEQESRRNSSLLLAELRNYQQGIMPTGPGARELTRFFASVEGALAENPAAPKVQGSDREVLALLSRRAETLHLGAANYCWFSDPSRALCLKLAGATGATTPLASMCDSARCPQATHHACHREVWAERAETTRSFLLTLGPTRRTERARLQADLDRACRVLAEIDAHSGEVPAGPVS